MKGVGSTELCAKPASGVISGQFRMDLQLPGIRQGIRSKRLTFVSTRVVSSLTTVSGTGKIRPCSGWGALRQLRRSGENHRSGHFGIDLAHRLLILGHDEPLCKNRLRYCIRIPVAASQRNFRCSNSAALQGSRDRTTATSPSY